MIRAVRCAAFLAAMALFIGWALFVILFSWIGGKATDERQERGE
ncbi:hypothetical protein [Bradyrhizobium sp.]